MSYRLSLFDHDAQGYRIRINYSTVVAWVTRGKLVGAFCGIFSTDAMGLQHRLNLGNYGTAVAQSNFSQASTQHRQGYFLACVHEINSSIVLICGNIVGEGLRLMVKLITQ